MKLTFITGLATYFNCVPYDLKMISWILFYLKAFCTDMVCYLEFFFEQKGKKSHWHNPAQMIKI